jgi:hypothetical protein
MDETSGVSPLTTALIAAGAVVVGAWLAGWMELRRERWAWFATARRDAYLDLLRAIPEVERAFSKVHKAVRDKLPERLLMSLLEEATGLRVNSSER